ncbi:CapA family protein [Serinicoccus kebangsaanensis]|uniref:CapA family protein n=1 Tax=Serinicoccus kebangsaanensis TaxID=2602069 RepID=UPI00124E7368|nr:CapA family protein [Serinicoccus kebangsaanensis]
MLTAATLLLAACQPTDAPGDGTSPAPTPSATATATAGDRPADTSAEVTATASPVPTTAAGEEELEITIAAGGDILPHSSVNVSAAGYAGTGADYDFSPMFADVAPLLREADLALCHLETPLSADNTALTVPRVLTFNTPYQIADALADAGFDGCDFASNHTLDRGLAGIESTEQVLADAGLEYAGPRSSPQTAGDPTWYDVATPDGRRVEVAQLALGYTIANYGHSNTEVPPDLPWLGQASWPVTGAEGILDRAREAREAGADFVVVTLHWGQEYQSAPLPEQTELAQELLSSDEVDLILGSHVHVIQPCERIDGKHVLYGMGNFLSNQSPQVNANLLPGTQEGMVALVTLTRAADGEVSTELRYQPTRVEIDPQGGPSHVIRRVSPETYPETWQRTTTTVDSLGGCGAEPITAGD